MKLRSFAICFAVLLAASAGWCQAGGSSESANAASSLPVPKDQPVSQEASFSSGLADSASKNGAEPAASASPETGWIPNAVNGETGTLSFLPRGERSNSLSAGITVVSTYDDNAFSDNRDKVGNLGYIVMPNISLQEYRPRTVLSLSYSPGFTMNQRLSPRYTADHDMRFNFQYRLTEHVTARFHDSLVYATTLYDRLSEPQFEPGGNVLHQANTAVITPLTNQITASSGVDLIDQVGQNTIVGATGYFWRLHFLSTSPTNAFLSDDQTSSGEAFYSTRVSRRNAVGVTYSYQNLATLGPIGERTNSNAALLFYTLYPKPGVNLSFFAGPDYITDQLTAARQAFWMPEGGATLGWQGLRTSLQLSAIRDVGDGGGLLGSVRRYMANAGVRHQFSREWIATLGLSYSYNDPLIQSFGGAFYAADARAGVERVIRQRLSVAVTYGREHQSFKIPSTMFPYSIADHNLAWVSISYHFSRPLGR
jgi:hypothetical protein